MGCTESTPARQVAAKPAAARPTQACKAAPGDIDDAAVRGDADNATDHVQEPIKPAEAAVHDPAAQPTPPSNTAPVPSSPAPAAPPPPAAVAVGLWDGSSAGSEGIHVMNRQDDPDAGWGDDWGRGAADGTVVLRTFLEQPTEPADVELMAAIEEGKTDTLLRLLRDKRVSPNGLDPFGHTPLHKAALRKGTAHELMVKYLISYGADVNACDKAWARPLHVAVRQRNLSAVRALLQATPTMADPLGKGGVDMKVTPIHTAADVGQHDALELLLRACPSPWDGVECTNGAGATPLHLAAKKGHSACVLTLIRRMQRSGLALDPQDSEGNTPVLLAAVGGHRDVIRVLLDAGANPAVSNCAGDTVDAVLRLRETQGYQGSNTTAYNPVTRGMDLSKEYTSTPVRRRRVPPGPAKADAAPASKPAPEDKDKEKDDPYSKRLSKGKAPPNPRKSPAPSAPAAGKAGAVGSFSRGGSGDLSRTSSNGSGTAPGGKKVIRKKSKTGKEKEKVTDAKEGKKPRDSTSASANTPPRPSFLSSDAAATAAPVHDRTFTEADFANWQRGGSLGKGAFGVVCEGLLRDGSVLAVKTISFGAEDQSEVEATREEFDLIKNMRHKNILQYYGVQILRDQLQIFMEIAPLGSVASLVKRIGAPLSVHVIRNFTRQLLEGLAYLHDRGVMHRDVKGDNLLLGEGNVLKLCDFGSSRRFNMMMTAANCKTLIGTPLWMAPEVINLEGSGSGYDAKADIWSVGIVQIEMLNSLPWKMAATETPWAVMFHIGSSGRLPDGIPEDCHPLLRAFMMKCLERSPKQRPNAATLLSHKFLTCDDDALDRAA
eukprot:TRINITY_DN707_c0_g5_i1.p1 TRINITY_DN707_c0_g5~~TRINITY_DN707_c0_g5_i1.p1  ORF type:complete len:829 (+),score=181.41 TRINITY_DN707_c0_g5_i1:94-2580(+)